MMTIAYIIAAVFAILIVLAAVAPNSYDVSRNILINKPMGEVFQYLRYVKNQSFWGPWGQRDPNMKQTFTGIDGTVGFISAWESDHKQVGSGEQEITKIVDNVEVECELRFLKPWKSVSIGYLKVFEEEGNQTKVVWGFQGKNNIPVSIMMLFFNMDKAIGKDFEEGLANLKKILEQ
jgi:hypothetical protein